MPVLKTYLSYRNPDIQWQGEAPEYWKVLLHRFKIPAECNNIMNSEASMEDQETQKELRAEDE
jgi:hypothetical protein